MKPLLYMICCFCIVSFAAQAQHLQLRQPPGKTLFLEQQLREKDKRGQLLKKNPPVRRNMRHISRPDPRRLNPRPKVNAIEKKSEQTYTAVPVAPVYQGGN